MNVQNIRGKAHVFGDNIDTDRILAGRYTKTSDRASLGQHVFEDLAPNFLKYFKPGDVVVAGRNFGCGSSREQAPLAIQAAGISAVIAHSFARIFFRNAVNIGLPIFEVGTHDIMDGDELEIDLKTREISILSTSKKYRSSEMPPIMVEIINAGGLVNYIKMSGDFSQKNGLYTAQNSDHKTG